ncbi:MAG: nucleoside 2-deoxyribosyltransferase [Erysipelotrichaceae bacterium]
MFVDNNGILRKPVAYLADFEMFLPDFPQTIKYWHNLCDKYGLVGYFPGEGVAKVKDYSANQSEMWKDICDNDIYGVVHCDFLIAQLDNWRGNQPDSGTAFELGLAIALNKPVYGFYTGEKEMILRSSISHFQLADELYDEKGYGIENQKYPLDNLFRLVKIADSFEGACQLARADFDQNLTENGYHKYKLIY